MIAVGNLMVFSSHTAEHKPQNNSSGRRCYHTTEEALGSWVVKRTDAQLLVKGLLEEEFWKIMGIYNAIFRDLESFGRREAFSKWLRKSFGFLFGAVLKCPDL